MAWMIHIGIIRRFISEIFTETQFCLVAKRILFSRICQKNQKKVSDIFLLSPHRQEYWNIKTNVKLINDLQILKRANKWIESQELFLYEESCSPGSPGPPGAHRQAWIDFQKMNYPKVCCLI